MKKGEGYIPPLTPFTCLSIVKGGWEGRAVLSVEQLAMMKFLWEEARGMYGRKGSRVNLREWARIRQLRMFGKRVVERVEKGLISSRWEQEANFKIGDGGENLNDPR
jgi:hypothetical protein